MKKAEARVIAATLPEVERRMMLSLPVDSWQTNHTANLFRFALVRIDVTKLVATKDGERVLKWLCPKCAVGMMPGKAIVPSVYSGDEGTQSEGPGTLQPCIKCPKCGFSRA